MCIHALETGTVRIHERQRAGRGGGPLRFLRTLADREWTPHLPILSWVVEHPEGLLVVDTGETAAAGRPGYFPAWHPYYRFAVRERVSPEQEVGPRLRALGLDPRDVRWVVMTHLHTDHAGGLHHFPDAEVLVSADEHSAARGLAGKIRGYLPHRWPDPFRPTVLDRWRDPDPVFGRAHVLTRAGDVRIVPTPGHTRGHVSVILEEEDQAVFLAGDTSYTEAALVDGIVDGVASMGGGVSTAARTLRKIRRQTELRPTVYLPSHDPDAARRLRERRTVTAPAALEAMVA